MLLAVIYFCKTSHLKKLKRNKEKKKGEIPEISVFGEIWIWTLDVVVTVTKLLD